MRYARRHKLNHSKAGGWHWLCQCISGSGTGIASGIRAERVRNSSFIIHHSSFRLPFRRAVTLVELLIVISIIMILMVITLRAMPKTEDRRVREAAREVNVYLSSARNRAMELGRPCGVIFRRANNTNIPTASTVLEQYEVPPPYAGDTTNAVVQVQQTTYGLRIRVRPNDFSDNLICPGDQIQFNNQGPYYYLNFSDSTLSPPDFRPQDTADIWSPFVFSGGSDSNVDGYIDNYCLTAVTPDMIMQTSPWPAAPNWSAPVPFKILSLYPFRNNSYQKTASSSLQLPAGTAVDLNFSGLGDWSFDVDPNLRVVGIVFSSNGTIQALQLYGWDETSKQYRYTAWWSNRPIFLLVGSSSRVRDYVNDPLPAIPNLNELPNWADLSSLWLTIDYHTGMVSTSENYSINFTTEKDPVKNQLIPWDKMIASDGYNNWAYFVKLSRKYAWESQSMGGR